MSSLDIQFHPNWTKEPEAEKRLSACVRAAGKSGASVVWSLEMAVRCVLNREARAALMVPALRWGQASLEWALNKTTR